MEFDSFGKAARAGMASNISDRDKGAECYKCGKTGHCSRDCWHPPKGGKERKGGKDKGNGKGGQDNTGNKVEGGNKGTRILGKIRGQTGTWLTLRKIMELAAWAPEAREAQMSVSGSKWLSTHVLGHTTGSWFTELTHAVQTGDG